VFLQLGDAVRNGRMTRSEGLYSRLQKKHPRFGHILGALFDLAGAAFFITIIIGGIPRFVDAWQRGYFSGIRGIFIVPVWPVRLVLVIGSLTVVFVFIGLAYRHLAALRKRSGDES
jgi:TRAP-type mannitol/chloroaromatic compound transport system permease small subunit